MQNRYSEALRQSEGLGRTELHANPTAFAELGDNPEPMSFGSKNFYRRFQ